MSSDKRYRLLDFVENSIQQFSHVSYIGIHVYVSWKKYFVLSAFDVGVFTNVVVVVQYVERYGGFVSVYVKSMFYGIGTVAYRGSGSCRERSELLSSRQSLRINVSDYVSRSYDSALGRIIVVVGYEYGVPVRY